jgi:hypothetical protein
MPDILGKAWTNGRGHSSSGQSYGIKIPSIQDRHQNFDRAWGTVQLLLEGLDCLVRANIDKDSFWGTNCGELIDVEIRRWMFSRGLAPWPDGNPPQFRLRPIAPGVVEVAPIE